MGEAAVRVRSEIAEERAALVALYNATDGPNWVNNENWLTDAPLGEWYGVDTDNAGRVVGLNLGGKWDFELGVIIPPWSHRPDPLRTRGPCQLNEAEPQT